MTERQLSFCMVTTFYPPYHFGGDAMYVYRLSNALARAGHHVTVVHNVDAYSVLRGGEPTEIFPNEMNVTVRALRSRFGAISPLASYMTGSPALMASSLHEILDGDFDVIHFHNISLMGGPSVLGYGRGIKLYTLHEHWLVCPMHVLWKYNRRPCEGPSCLRCTLSFRRPPQLWRYSGKLERDVQYVDAFLSPSRFTAAKHRERGFTHPIRHLPLFVPEPPVVGEAPSDARPYFLFAGRLERLKGVQTLLEVFAKYDSAELVIAGDGDYAGELKRQAGGLEHVRFVGRRDTATLGSLYAHAIALIVPTVGFEVFPFVTLEAFAHRTPAIVRDRGGLPEAIVDSGAGFTYRTDDELVAAMEALRLDNLLRDELGRRGYDAYRQQWSEKPHLREYLKIVEELLLAEQQRAVRSR